jgi:hypothetical protein
MLTKCLNTACTVPFRYLREGRIFHLQLPPRPDSPGPGRREYFWLCGQCSNTLTIVIKDGVGTVQPRFLELPGGPTVEQPEEEVPFVS